MSGIIIGFVIALLCVRICNWNAQVHQAHSKPDSAVRDAWQVRLPTEHGADDEVKADDESKRESEGSADSEHHDFEVSLPGKLHDSFASPHSVPSLHEACMSYISENSTTAPMDEKSALTLVSLASSDLETLTSLRDCSGEVLEVNQFLRNLLGHCRVFRDFGLAGLLVSEKATQRFLERKMHFHSHREERQRQRELEIEQLQGKVWSLSHQLMNVERVREELLEKCNAKSGMPGANSEEVIVLRRHMAQELAEFSRLEALRKQDAEAVQQKQDEVDQLECNDEKQLHAELVSLRETLAEKQDQVDRLEGNEKRLHAELASLKKKLQRKQCQIDSLRQKLNGPTDQIAAPPSDLDDQELAAFGNAEDVIEDKFRQEQLRCQILEKQHSEKVHELETHAWMLEKQHSERVHELETRAWKLHELGKELLQIKDSNIDSDTKVKTLQPQVQAMEEELQRSRRRYKELSVFKLDVIARELRSFERKLEAQRVDIQLLRRTSTKQLQNSDDQDWLALRCIDLVASCRELKSHVQDVIHKCLSETQKLHIGSHIDEPRKAGQLSHGGWLSGNFEEVPGPSDWVVTSDSGLVVRAAPDSQASVQGYLDFCAVVRGEAEGDWLKLADGRGHVMLNSEEGPLLKSGSLDDYTASKPYHMRQKDEMLRERRLKRKEGFEHPRSS